MVFVVEVLAAGCVVAGALPFGCVVVVEAGVVVVLPGFGVVVVDAPGGVVLGVPLGCEGAVVEDGVVGGGVIGAIVSPGFGSGLDVMPAISSLRPASEPLLRYL